MTMMRVVTITVTMMTFTTTLPLLRDEKYEDDDKNDAMMMTMHLTVSEPWRPLQDDVILRWGVASTKPFPAQKGKPGFSGVFFFMPRSDSIPGQPK